MYTSTELRGKKIGRSPKGRGGKKDLFFQKSYQIINNNNGLGGRNPWEVENTSIFVSEEGGGGETLQEGSGSRKEGILKFKTGKEATGILGRRGNDFLYILGKEEFDCRSDTLFPETIQRGRKRTVSGGKREKCSYPLQDEEEGKRWGGRGGDAAASASRGRAAAVSKKNGKERDRDGGGGEKGKCSPIIIKERRG